MSGPDVKIKMINCVRKYPGLYKPTYEMYRNRNYSITAWEKIIKECNIESIAKAKDMWAGLRKSYIGHLKAPGKNPPKYFQEMSFLRQYIPETAADGFNDDEPVKLKTVAPAVFKPTTKKQENAKVGAVKQPKQPRIKIPDDLKLFFDSMYATTKKLPSSLQRHVRNQIFEIVSYAENAMD